MRKFKFKTRPKFKISYVWQCLPNQMQVKIRMIQFPADSNNMALSYAGWIYEWDIRLMTIKQALKNLLYHINKENGYTDGIREF